MAGHQGLRVAALWVGTAAVAASLRSDGSDQAAGAVLVDQRAAAPAVSEQVVVGAMEKGGDGGRVGLRRLERRGQRHGDDVGQVDRLGRDVRGVDLVGDGRLFQSDGHRRVDESEAFLKGQFRRRRGSLGG